MAMPALFATASAHLATIAISSSTTGIIGPALANSSGSKLLPISFEWLWKTGPSATSVQRLSSSSRPK